jgi:hypothetical protein
VNTTVNVVGTQGLARNINAASSYATITQLGSSAVIAGSYPGTWTSYTPTVTGSVANPTTPTSATFNCAYKVEGKTLYINFKYYAPTTTGGVDGTGAYLYSIPAGYLIDTTKVAIPTVISTAANAGIDGGTIGAGFIRNSTAANSAGMWVMPLSTTQFGFWAETAPGLQSSAKFSMQGAAQMAIGATLQIPIQ